MSNDNTKHLALLMAVNCVRNTVIEDYHVKYKITDEDMKRFNKEVVNKLYTFMDYMSNRPNSDWSVFLSGMEIMFPSNWDAPEIDQNFLKLTENLKKNGNPFQR